MYSPKKMETRKCVNQIRFTNLREITKINLSSDISVFKGNAPKIKLEQMTND